MLVVIEGIDGTGKGSVTRALVKAITACSTYKTKHISFPRYAETSYGKIVGKYLNGDFGDSSEHPLMHGTLFALDRFESKSYLQRLLREFDFVICDRYVPSNLCYSAMIAPDGEAESVVNHFMDLEYDFFKMPKPDAIFVLNMSISTAISNIAKKGQRQYTDRSADIFEADKEYLQKVKSFYTEELQTLHSGVYFKTIECENEKELLPIESIVQAILDTLFKLKAVNDGKETAFFKTTQQRVC